MLRIPITTPSTKLLGGHRFMTQTVWDGPHIFERKPEIDHGRGASTELPGSPFGGRLPTG